MPSFAVRRSSRRASFYRAEINPRLCSSICGVKNAGAWFYTLLRFFRVFGLIAWGTGQSWGCRASTAQSDPVVAQRAGLETPIRDPTTPTRSARNWHQLVSKVTRALPYIG